MQLVSCLLIANWLCRLHAYKVRPLRAAARSTPERGGIGMSSDAEFDQRGPDGGHASGASSQISGNSQPCRYFRIFAGKLGE